MQLNIFPFFTCLVIDIFYITYCMPARIPTQRKTPFAIDPRPLRECASAHAGLLAFSRAFRSLQLPGLIEANVQVKDRQRGQSAGEFIESLVLLQLAGGSCPEDLQLLRADPALQRGLGFLPPTASAARKFLKRFHDPSLEQLRPPRAQQRSFILPASSAGQQLQTVQAGLVAAVARRYQQRGRGLKIATVDADATIIESHKRTALPHYEGGRGYQPVVAVWAEADLVLADQWRDGNVPARQAPLDCVQLAFASLPSSGIQARLFRGDSACHEHDLLQWLSAPQRAEEPGGAITFAVSASMSPELAAAMRAIADNQWKSFAQEADGTLRQHAEVAFVPSQRGEKKDARPLRYVGLRLLKPQGELFGDGSDRHFHAVITNADWSGDRLLNWHREKAGTIEHVHDAVKNHLAGGHVPSQQFGANAAWFKLSLLAYNLASAVRGLALIEEESLRDAELKKLRFQLIHIGGRMSRSQCVLRLRFQASAEQIALFLKIWEVFPLPTHATAFH